MAAPLPTGSSLQALPQAPQIQDPRLYASDTAGALASAQAGMQLGQELANLQNKQKERELKTLQIKHDKALNDLQMSQIANAQEMLPKLVAQQVAESLANTKAAQNKLALEEAFARLNVPASQASAAASAATLAGETADAQLKSGAHKTSAEAAKVQAENARLRALADQPGANRTTEQATQALAASTALGNMGVPEGTAGSTVNGVPLKLTHPETKQFLDENGDKFEQSVVVDNRTGQTLAGGEPLKIAQSADRRSHTQLMARAVDLSQTAGMVEDAVTALDQFIKDSPKGIVGPFKNVGQVWATNAANSSGKGFLGLGAVTKAAGTYGQSDQSVKVVAALQAVQSSIMRAISGATVSKEEVERLQALMPTSQDMVNPAHARVKLDQTIQYMGNLMAPLKEKGLLDDTGKVFSSPKLSVRAEAESRKQPAAALAPTPPPPTVAQPPLGTEEIRNGVKWRREIRNGKPGWARVK